jgi:hypothetical protein
LNAIRVRLWLPLTKAKRKTAPGSIPPFSSSRYGRRYYFSAPPRGDRFRVFHFLSGMAFFKTILFEKMFFFYPR